MVPRGLLASVTRAGQRRRAAGATLCQGRGRWRRVARVAFGQMRWHCRVKMCVCVCLNVCVHMCVRSHVIDEHLIEHRQAWQNVTD